MTDVSPVSSSTTAKSVKVPPISMPTRRLMGVSPLVVVMVVKLGGRLAHVADGGVELVA